MSRGPDLARRELWRRRFGEFDRGTATVAEFCRRTGVSQATFYAWRHKLRSSGQHGRRPEPGPSPAKVASLSFLPIEITGRDDPSAPIEVVFPNGTRLLVLGRDQGTLSQVIAALASSSREARSC